jgi:mono/diheme cytochrome c family protein
MMRYFLVIFALCVVAAVCVAGRRGSVSRKPPIYLFPDMDRQLKLRPQEPNGFFPNGVSSQLPVAGTVAQARPLVVGATEVFPYEDSPVFSGRMAGATNFIETNPYPVTAQLLKRGQERFTIHCAPCHGQLGDGNGITKKIGAMAVAANLHDKRIVVMPDGELFNTITHGKNLMGAYGPNVPVPDRWAVIAYLRALHLSRLGSADDVPPELRGSLKK